MTFIFFKISLLTLATYIPFKYKNVISPQTMHKIIKTNSQSAKYRYNLINNPSYPKKKDLDSKNRIRVTVIGHRTSKEFIYCYHLVKGLCKYRSKEYEQPVLRGVTDVEWNDIWQNLKVQYGIKAINLVNEVAVIINDELIGGENELKQIIESKYVYHLCLDYCKESIEQLRKYITSTGRPCAYMQISINGEDAGTLLFSLYSDLVPRTCENFLRLCEATKGGYAGTPVHRIVKDCWIQCGGFGLKEDPNLGCENFLVPHDRRGVLCMANNGRHVECSTQFFVLLQPAPWMKHKYVGFGQLIEGEETLRKIENVPSWYESPTQDIVIHKAGVLNMDCQYKPINKNTHQYLEGHVEDLIALGEFLYEELLRKVFEEVELKQKQKLDNIADDDKNTPESDVSKENNDFDVETYENEYQYYSPYAYSRVSELTKIKLEKPFYIPFTDVPYEGELDSQYNLLRLLMGNYCYDVDLESDPEKGKSKHHGERLSIPYGFVSELFETCNLDDSDTSDDSSIDSSKTEIYDNYVSQYMTSVSFAGHVVEKIANINKKFDVFDKKKGADNAHRLLTDEELRILRLTKKEYETRQPKSVSISLIGSKFSQNKIIRRPTGFVFLEDLAELGISLETLGEEHECEREDIRKCTDSEFCLSLGLRESTFVRLMDSVKKHSEEDDLPTLKNYKSSLPELQKDINLISFSETCHLTNVEPNKTVSEWELYRALGVFKDIHRAPLIPQSPRVFGKSPTANFYNGQENNSSITAVEFAKKRPTITVNDYKMKNKQYHKQLNLKTGIP